VNIRRKKYNNLGIFIQARLGSTRFPQKIIYKADSKKNVIDYLITRLLKVFDKEQIYILTTKKIKDKKFCYNLANKYEINFFFGSENNLLKRYYDCAKKFKIKKIIRITSDCPLVDPFLIKSFIRKSNDHKNYDYYTNCAPYESRSYAVGSDIEIVNFNILKKIIKKNNSIYDKEHITPLLLKTKYYHFKSKTNDRYFRFTLDYKKDLLVIKKIIRQEKINKKIITYREIIEFLKANPSISKNNSRYVSLYYKKKIRDKN